MTSKLKSIEQRNEEKWGVRRLKWSSLRGKGSSSEASAGKDYTESRGQVKTKVTMKVVLEGPATNATIDMQLLDKLDTHTESTLSHRICRSLKCDVT